MTDAPDDIRARGLRSIDRALASFDSESGRMFFRDSLIRTHIPFCVELAFYSDDKSPRIARLLRQALTILIMVNAFNEFIRTTYPEERWKSESDTLRTLLNAALDEGPLC
jgi:hypothetical protein